MALLPAVALAICLHLATGSPFADELLKHHERAAKKEAELPPPWENNSGKSFSIDDAIIKSTEKEAPKHADDMMLTEKQQMRLFMGLRSRDDTHRVVATPWTDGVIPYEVQQQDFNREQLDWIQRAMRNWEKVTCVRFRPATSSDRNKIRIVTGQGCWANLGMIGGTQTVNLDPNCFWKGTIEHEFGHTLGMIHEHQRENRDQYIRVNYYATTTDQVRSLTKYALGSDDKYGVEYDYHSVMHYGKTAFSKDWKTETIYTRDRTMTDVIGMILGPSYLDAKFINLMYKCKDKCHRPPSCGSDCFVTEDCVCQCKNNWREEPCRDKHRDCPSRTQNGACDNDQIYSHTLCQKSCGICKTDGSIAHLPCTGDNLNSVGGCVHEYWRPLACSDTGHNCAARAREGECTRNPATMLKECVQSCDFCVEDIDNPPIKKPGECKDYDYACQLWKDNGRCVRNYALMTMTCPQHCDMCGQQVTLPEGCVDTNTECMNWAFSGECENNPGYMLSGCKLSCNSCPGLEKPDVCVDYDHQCPKWASQGECERSPWWMTQNCRVSCKTCEETCFDSQMLCVMWAAIGECDNNPDWMKDKCPRSCKACTPTVAIFDTCQDFDGNCEWWAGNGECDANPDWMKGYCPKACKVCTPGGSTGGGGGGSVTTTPSTGDCVDNNADCEVWARDGHCEKNPGYMLSNCRKSCQVCGGGGGGQTTPRPSGNCVDQNSDCEMWANTGQCDMNPGYMLEFCKKACGVCGGGGGSITTTPSTGGNCVDQNSDCEMWANTGQCDMNPGYMLEFCKKACGVCGGGGGSVTTPSTGGGNCVDQNSDCEMWANTGQCDMNPGYMLEFCKKACGVCGGGGGGGSCQDDNQGCPGWADYGECDRNPGYMHIHCKKSCRIC